MSKSMTNFRAKDMLEGGNVTPAPEPTVVEPEPQVVPEPEPEPVAPDEESQSSDNADEQPVTSSATEVPDGTVPEVLEWVGDDRTRAQAAFDAEHTKSKPRATLIDQLSDILRG